jgi:hypothetical protein
MVKGLRDYLRQAQHWPDGPLHVMIDAIEGNLTEKVSRGLGPLIKATRARADGTALIR